MVLTWPHMSQRITSSIVTSSPSFKRRKHRLPPANYMVRSTCETEGIIEALFRKYILPQADRMHQFMVSSWENSEKELGKKGLRINIPFPFYLILKKTTSVGIFYFISLNIGQPLLLRFLST